MYLPLFFKKIYETVKQYLHKTVCLGSGYKVTIEGIKTKVKNSKDFSDSVD